MSEATPRASDAPDIVPVAWGAGKGMSGFMWITDLSAQADSWRKDGREVEPLIRLSDHTDALAALRAERASWKSRSDEAQGWSLSHLARAEAAEAEVARLKDALHEIARETTDDQVGDTWATNGAMIAIRSLTASKGG